MGGASSGDENVVRFPREWIGPLEDLVPIGSPSDGADPGVTPEENLPPAADAFWTENAGALHDALQAPDGSPAPVKGEPQSHPTATRTRRRFRPNLRAVRVQLRWVGVALVGLAVVAMAVIGTAWQSGSGTGTQRAAQRPRIARPNTATTRLAERGSLSRSSTSTRLAHRTVKGRRQTPERARTRSPHRSHPTVKSVVTASSAQTPATSEPVSVGRSYSPPNNVPESPTGGSAPVSTTEPSSGSSAGGGTSSQSNAGSAPAFGSGGALGPGSSPAS